MRSLLSKYGFYYLARPDIGEIGLTDDDRMESLAKFIWIYQWKTNEPAL